MLKGSGTVGTVGRAVGSKTRDPQFEYSHHLKNLFTVKCTEKIKIDKTGNREQPNFKILF